jgi:hypothetical protein
MCKKDLAHTCNPSYLEAEFRRITVQGQLIQKVLETPSHQKKLGMVTITCHPSYYRKHK